MGGEDVPVGLSNAVASPSPVDSGEVERAVQINVRMSEIEPPAERHEVTLCGEGFRCVGWANHMSHDGWCWCCDIAKWVVLKPVLLIRCILPDVLMMQNIKLDKKFTVLEA